MVQLELALANVGNKFPTWEEILAIVVLDGLLIVGTFFLFRRSLRRSRRSSRSTLDVQPHSGRLGLTPRDDEKDD